MPSLKIPPHWDCLSGSFHRSLMPVEDFGNSVANLSWPA